jgi:hypothetical protein
MYDGFPLLLTRGTTVYDRFSLLLTMCTTRQEYIRVTLDPQVFTNTREYDGARGADNRWTQLLVELEDLNFINKLLFDLL